MTGETKKEWHAGMGEGQESGRQEVDKKQDSQENRKRVGGEAPGPPGER